MKRLSHYKFKILLSLSFLLLCINAFPQSSETSINVMTFNIRYDNPNDGENSWENRKENLVDVIKNYDADIIGMQEVLKNQLDYIATKLKGYGWTGIGRDDGKNSGEFSPIFYNKNKSDFLESATFWCSPTPGKPGLGWDAVCNRIVTWGKFKDKNSGKVFYVFNTHFDHIGVEARKNSALLIIDKINSICGGEPVVITGDFNSTPADEPYKIITASGNKSNYNFSDSKSISVTKHKGPEGTFTGFYTNEPATGPIDYIFISDGAKVESHSTITDKTNGHLPSDHFPVIAQIIF